MKKLPIHVKIVIGLVLGIVWAFLSSFMGWNEFTIRWIDPFGMIFIRLLKFIAVPLVLFSIIGGVSGLRDVSKLGRLGWKTLLAYMTTTLLAVGIGLTLVNIVKPGTHIDDEQRIKNRLSYEVWLQENDIGATQDGLNFLSDPKYAAYLSEAQAAEQVTSPKLDLEKKMKTVAVQKESSPLKFIVEMVPDNINLVNGMNSIFLKMVDLVMKAAPFFVFCLLAGVVAKMADSPQEVFEIFIGLGSYSLTLFSGLFLLTFVVYPLIVKSLVSKMSFKDFFKNISPAQFLAFSTSSSAATLPVTMECVEENVGVPKSISSFVLPIGATVNMDGTSMFEGVAVVFLAQLHFIDLTIAQQLTIVFTAAAASIGSAAVPSAGLIMMIMVLQSVGLNPAWVAIIFPVDRILDMCRTVVNVTGDMVVSTLIAKSEGELEKYS